ncbi:hypothetical protein JK358_32805 [Nocardia sp. 2]|uniref:DUF6891 domain-containing protein n=1 Tax=Nocardia acididurans TaxID=2802282 RepID=A0ABS1MF62_9NOCA|nr:hypothetical protein [Nocardia acididurans]MBL1079196.1 hypothetical protein [Nocardia acididurans]
MLDTRTTDTDCDRLVRAFAALRLRDVAAMHSAGDTMAQGLEDVDQVLGESPAYIGYCFYHGQDVERAMAGEGLYLAFGPRDPDLEESEGPAIGHMIVEELTRTGLTPTWDGTFDQRILIESFDWHAR